MNFYWSLKSVPELAGLPARQRRRIHESCLRQHFIFASLTRRSLAAHLVFIASAGVIMTIGESILPMLGVHRSMWFSLILAALGIGVGRFLFSRIAIPSLRPFYSKLIESEHEHAA